MYVRLTFNASNKFQTDCYRAVFTIVWHHCVILQNFVLFGDGGDKFLDV